MIPHHQNNNQYGHNQQNPQKRIYSNAPDGGEGLIEKLPMMHAQLLLINLQKCRS